MDPVVKSGGGGRAREAFDGLRRRLGPPLVPTPHVRFARVRRWISAFLQRLAHWISDVPARWRCMIAGQRGEEDLFICHLPSRRQARMILGRLPSVRLAASDETGAPETSVVVVAWQNLALTRLCVESVLENPGIELVVVDNRSTDGTQEFLRQLADRDPRVRPVFNAANLGFPIAANQGLRVARGRRLVILNNDVIVPPIGLSRLLRHLDDPDVGLVGPRTNHIATEARIPASYHTRREMDALAARLAALHSGEIADVPMLALFCAALRRDAFERVGELDGRFGLGLFEDDDYSLRMRVAGYRVACALDSFVHHFGGAGFRRLLPGLAYEQTFDENRRRFERKWGRRWRRRELGSLCGERHLDEASGRTEGVDPFA